MCGTSYTVARLNRTSRGATAATRPSGPRVNPAGWFIQALAATTENVPPMPDRATGMPLSRWARGERRRQP